MGQAHLIPAGTVLRSCKVLFELQAWEGAVCGRMLCRLTPGKCLLAGAFLNLHHVMRCMMHACPQAGHLAGTMQALLKHEGVP